MQLACKFWFNFGVVDVGFVAKNLETQNYPTSYIKCLKVEIDGLRVKSPAGAVNLSQHDSMLIVGLLMVVSGNMICAFWVVLVN